MRRDQTNETDGPGIAYCDGHCHRDCHETEHPEQDGIEAESLCLIIPRGKNIHRPRYEYKQKCQQRCGDQEDRRLVPIDPPDPPDSPIVDGLKVLL